MKLLPLALVVSAIALLAAPSASATPVAYPTALAPVGLSAAPTHTCSSGWKHAIIGGVHKCLRAGQFCTRRYDAQYRRYGYRCIKRDSSGRYRLTRA